MSKTKQTKASKGIKPSKFKVGQRVQWMVQISKVREVSVSGIIKEVRGNSANGYSYLIILVTYDMVVKSESVLSLSK